MDGATPRVDATIVAQFSGKMVRIIGKIEQSSGNEAVMSANGAVKLLVQSEPLENGRFYEVIGKVGDDSIVRVVSSIKFNDINEKAAAHLVQYVHKVPSLYY